MLRGIIEHARLVDHIGQMFRVPRRETVMSARLDVKQLIERIAIGLPEQNTVVPAQLSARASPQEPWQVIASNVLCRLRQGDGEVNSPPVMVNGIALRYWRLHVDPNAGGFLPPCVRDHPNRTSSSDVALGTQVDPRASCLLRT